MVHVHGRFHGDGTVRLLHALRHAARHRRRRIADVDLAGADVVLAAIQHHRLGQARDGVLGRRVGRAVRARRVRADRTVVDDAPALRRLFLHHAEGGLGAEEGTRQVHRDHAGPVLVGQVLERRAGHVLAGIVEQHVEPARLLLHRGEECGDRGRVGDVGDHRDGARGIGAGERRRLLQRLHPAAGEVDGPAAAQQGEGGGAADAGAGSGDDGDLAGGGHPRFLIQTFESRAMCAGLAGLATAVAAQPGHRHPPRRETAGGLHGGLA